MMGLSNPIHIIFLLAILLLVFGAKRLPEMGRSLGSGLRGFKESISDDAAETGDTQISQHPEATVAPVAIHKPEIVPAPEPPRQAA